MAGEAQVAWDEPQSQAQPQVSWDEEKPKQKPQMPGVKDWLKSAFWLPKLSETLGKTSEFAESKRNEAEEKNLGEVARTGKNPNPIAAYAPSAGWDLAARAARTASGLTSPKSLAIGAGATVAPEIVGPAMLAHGGYTALKHAKAAMGGNPEEAEAALGGAAEATGGAALGASALAPGTPKTFTRNALSAANRTLIKGQPPNALVPEASKAFTQAIQPGVNIPRAQESIQIAGPRMKQVMEDEGLNLRREKGENAVPVTKKALDVIKTAKQQVHSAIEDRLGPVADLSPSTEPVAKAMEDSISGRTVRQFPKDAEAIQKRADTYRGNLSLREIENSIQDANNELRNYYKRPGATDSPTSAHMDATLAEVKALRSLLDEKVESLSGEGVAPLKREYGALRDVERAVAKQHAIATRTKEGGLWEGLSYLHAAGDLLSGNALGAARAGGAITVGRMLKTLRDPNFLIEQSFHGPKAFEAAERIAPHAGPPAPRALLNAPATELGFTPEPQGPISRPQNKGLLPPAQPIEAEFIPRRIPVAPARVGVNRMLPGERTTNIPPLANAARETILPPDETRLGPTGEAGIRIPIKGLLPAAREAMGTPPPPAPKPNYTPSEKAATMSAPAKNYGPEFNAQQAQEEINRNQAILRNPKATAEERSIAEDRLRDAKEPTFGAAALKAAKETEPVETKIKGITAEEPKAAKPKKEAEPPVEKRFSRDEITDAEGLINQEVGMLQSADRPGRYFDESAEGEHVLTGNQRLGIDRMGGSWRGVSSLRDAMPFLKEHPDWSPGQLEKALRNKDSAFYKKAISAAVDFIRNENATAEAAEREAIQAEPEKEPEGVLPGFGQAVKEQEAGAGKVKAEELTREANTPRNVDEAAARLETKGPLFRGTEASPQREIFGQQALSAAKGNGVARPGDAVVLRDSDMGTEGELLSFDPNSGAARVRISNGRHAGLITVVDAAKVQKK